MRRPGGAGHRHASAAGPPCKPDRAGRRPKGAPAADAGALAWPGATSRPVCALMAAPGGGADAGGIAPRASRCCTRAAARRSRQAAPAAGCVRRWMHCGPSPPAGRLHPDLKMQEPRGRPWAGSAAAHRSRRARPEDIPLSQFHAIPAAERQFADCGACQGRSARYSQRIGWGGIPRAPAGSDDWARKGDGMPERSNSTDFRIRAWQTPRLQCPCLVGPVAPTLRAGKYQIDAKRVAATRFFLFQTEVSV